MTKNVKKIQEVVKLNKPKFNEKYKVWVVRMKTKTGWKAIWRKSKESSQEVYDYLIPKIVKDEVNADKSKPSNLNKVTGDNKMGNIEESKPMVNSIVGKLFGGKSNAE